MEVKTDKHSSSLRRRSFLKVAGSFSLALGSGIAPAFANAKPRVVILGAGAGGAVAAKTLARLAGDRLDLTIVDRQAVYHAPFFSERVIAGVWSPDQMEMNALASCKAAGVKTIQGSVEAIDRNVKQVILSDGMKLDYDHLIASPGISFADEQKEGYDADLMPHGWFADGGVNRLTDQIRSMPDDGLVVMTIPKRPYRCPAGPYSRATGIAYYLKNNKPDARLLLLDDENSFIMQALFEAAWADNYEDYIEWLPIDMHGGITGYSGTAGELIVHTDLEDVEAHVVNAIPLQHASNLLLSAELGGGENWCPVDMGFRSTIDPSIQIIGDSAKASPMAKAAESAFLQAERAAQALLIQLGMGTDLVAEGVSGCWSFVTDKDTIYHREVYRFTDHIELAEITENDVEEDTETRAAAEALADEWFEQARALIG